MRAIFLNRKPLLDDETVNKLFLGVIAVLILALSHTIAAVFGGWYVIDQARQEAAKIVATNAHRVPPVVQPAQLLKCDKAGREEFLRTCRARTRSAEVGAK